MSERRRWRASLKKGQGYYCQGYLFVASLLQKLFELDLLILAKGSSQGL